MWLFVNPCIMESGRAGRPDPTGETPLPQDKVQTTNLKSYTVAGKARILLGLRLNKT